MPPTNGVLDPEFKWVLLGPTAAAYIIQDPLKGTFKGSLKGTAKGSLIRSEMFKDLGTLQVSRLRNIRPPHDALSPT